MRFSLPLAAGLGLTLLYLLVAIFVIWQDRLHSGGDWISLNGISSYLVTFPISAACERLGRKLDFRRNVDMTLAIAGSGFLLFWLAFGIAHLLRACAAAAFGK